MAEQNQTDKTLKGYKIVIIILAVILAALTFFFLVQMKELRGERADLTEQRDTLVNRLSNMMVDFDNLQTENDTINANLVIERGRADSLLQKLQQERNLSQSKIRQYERELGTLRSVMQNYVRQIDSLNTINQALVQENVQYRRNESTLRRQVERAEETVAEQAARLQQGAVVRARNIALVAVRGTNDNDVRASRAERLRVDLVLTANELATPGTRMVYARIAGPDGYALATSPDNIFDYEGEKLSFSASREVEYTNDDLSVSIYYNGSGITSGKYSVSIYMDGKLIGSNEMILR